LFNNLIALFNSLLVYNTPGKECQEKMAVPGMGQKKTKNTPTTCKKASKVL
jgi:hypothetical protein